MPADTGSWVSAEGGGALGVEPPSPPWGATPSPLRRSLVVRAPPPPPWGSPAGVCVCVSSALPPPSPAAMCAVGARCVCFQESVMHSASAPVRRGLAVPFSAARVCVWRAGGGGGCDRHGGHQNPARELQHSRGRRRRGGRGAARGGVPARAGGRCSIIRAEGPFRAGPPDCSLMRMCRALCRAVCCCSVCCVLLFRVLCRAALRCARAFLPHCSALPLYRVHFERCVSRAA